MTGETPHDWSEYERWVVESAADDSSRNLGKTFTEKLEQVGADADVELTITAEVAFITLFHEGEMTRKELKHSCRIRARTTVDRVLRQLREINAVEERPHPDDNRKKLYRLPSSKENGQ